FLFQSGHAVVADFGIARAISAAGGTRSRALTQPGAAIGTPDYMSPEQAFGEPELDGRSDQYALACVLYEMLAGQPPFTGPTVESVLLRHLTVPAPRITDVQPDVPKPVAAALTRALAKTPAERFSGMAAFVEAIGAPEAPAGAPPPAQLTSFIGRERETAAVLELLQGTRLPTLESGARPAPRRRRVGRAPRRHPIGRGRSARGAARLGSTARAGQLRASGRRVRPAGGGVAAGLPAAPHHDHEPGGARDRR